MVLAENEEKRHGWASCLQLKCERCRKKTETMTSKVVTTGRAHEGEQERNRRGVFAMKGIGCGVKVEKLECVNHVPMQADVCSVGHTQGKCEKLADGTGLGDQGRLTKQLMKIYSSIMVGL